MCHSWRNSKSQPVAERREAYSFVRRHLACSHRQGWTTEYDPPVPLPAKIGQSKFTELRGCPTPGQGRDRRAAGTTTVDRSSQPGLRRHSVTPPSWTTRQSHLNESDGAGGWLGRVAVSRTAPPIGRYSSKRRPAVPLSRTPFQAGKRRTLVPEILTCVHVDFPPCLGAKVSSSSMRSFSLSSCRCQA